MSFIKWSGGKSQVVYLIKDYFPDLSKVNGYVEPFLGGGSVFFYLKENAHLNGKIVYLSDVNSELINTYKIVRDNLYELVPLLERHEKLNCQEYYDKAKKIFPANSGNLSNVEKAGYFIYLVNNSMAGMWLLHKDGTCANQYIGDKYKTNNLVKDELFACSKLLKNTNINCMSFENILRIKDVNTFFYYFDPPYFVVTRQQHTKSGFDNVKRNLYPVFKELDRRGCKIMLSNSDSDIITRNFKDYNIIKIQTGRKHIDLVKVTEENMQNAKCWSELIVVNYEPKIYKQMSIFDNFDY